MICMCLKKYKYRVILNISSEVFKKLIKLDKTIKDTHNSAGFSVGGCLGTTQGPEDGEGGGHVLEGVSLRTSSGDVKQLPEYCQ